MTNSLLAGSILPDFDNLSAADVVPAIESIISENRKAIENLFDSATGTFAELVQPLEELNHRLQTAWSPVTHMQMICNDRDWRDAHAEAVPLITEYATELAQNEKLHAAFVGLNGAAPGDSTREQLSVIAHTLRDFRKAGVGLSGEEKNRFRAVMGDLASATTAFSQNLQDATDDWQLETDSQELLAGLPGAVVLRAKERAKSEQKNGWVLGLDVPTFQAVLTHADDVSLRRRFYEAWVTRASDRGPGAGRFDNRDLIDRILTLRHEAAELVGFSNYAEYALDGRMAATSAEVLDFLNDLAARSLPAARRELEEIEKFARRPLEAWDLSYYSEKLKDARYRISDERLRPYLPATRVIDGLFELAQKLYGISIKPRDGVSVWHESVIFLDVFDDSGTELGSFYADLYAREGKRGGAWIDECVVRKSFDGATTLPVGYLVCNFSPPDSAGVALLTHGEVVTLFHEFGHMMHHLLTRMHYPSIAGINGVPWDAVELPSQFMENFAWDRSVLDMVSGHHETGAKLPGDLFDKLTESRQFNAGLAMLRQIEFALFDFRLHAEFDGTNRAIVEAVLADVRASVTVAPVPDWNRFPNSFSHIFAGGYAAGYYSYKWAEVLAADAFSAFDMARGIDHETAHRFRRSILEIGGSRDILEAFVEFRGREPKLDALLQVSGILN